MDNTFYNCFLRRRQPQDGSSCRMTEDRVSPAMLRWTVRSELLGFHVDDPGPGICRLWLRCCSRLPDLARSRWSEGQRNAHVVIIDEARTASGAAAQSGGRSDPLWDCCPLHTTSAGARLLAAHTVKADSVAHLYRTSPVSRREASPTPSN